MTSICLSMIVKNEAHVIERCLRSVRPMIASWVIVDTGSTDGTQDVIRHTLSDLQGMVYERPWVNFGHNRTEALELARRWKKSSVLADYALVIDADDHLVFTPDWKQPSGADAYSIRIVDQASNTSWNRVQIFSNRLPWRYVGALHEYPECDRPHRQEILEGVTCIRGYDGARAKDPARFERDILLLQEELLKDKYNSRARFYLAQSYRDAGRIDEAIDAYGFRASMGGWGEEVYFSALQYAALIERRGDEPDWVRKAYVRAHDIRPKRAEAMCYLARYHRLRGEFKEAYQDASVAIAIPRPNDILFVDESVYAWRALDEFAVATYHLGAHLASAAACKRLLTEGRLPPSETQRVLQNLAFAEAVLSGLNQSPSPPV